MWKARPFILSVSTRNVVSIVIGSKIAGYESYRKRLDQPIKHGGQTQLLETALYALT